MSRTASFLGISCIAAGLSLVMATHVFASSVTVGQCAWARMTLEP